MRRFTRLVILIAAVVAIAASSPTGALAQRRRPAPAGRPHAVQRSAVVFVGGYFYDPFFGPYPWWHRGAYPYPYYPIYDNRAVVRVIATPKDAAVYVDGFYAGTVHDFNDWFQGLPLSPGGHEIALYLEGYRTVRDRVYLAPGSTFKVRRTLERLAPGEISATPPIAAPIPPPPEGTFLPPRTARSVPPRAALAAPPAVAQGTLSIRIEPANADVLIDGERWTSSDGRHLVIQLAAGPHRVDAAKAGYVKYSSEVQVRDGETTQLNVSLALEKP